MLMPFFSLILINLTYFIGKRFYAQIDNRWIILVLSCAAAVKLPLHETDSYQARFWDIFHVFPASPLTAVLLANAALYLRAKKSAKHHRYCVLIGAQISAILFVYYYSFMKMFS